MNCIKKLVLENKNTYVDTGCSKINGHNSNAIYSVKVKGYSKSKSKVMDSFKKSLGNDNFEDGALCNYIVTKAFLISILDTKVCNF